MPDTRSRLPCGFHANDAYSAYIEMGSPKNLTAEQVANLNQLTRDLPEKNETIRSTKDGTFEVTVRIDTATTSCW